MHGELGGLLQCITAVILAAHPVPIPWRVRGARSELQRRSRYPELPALTPALPRGEGEASERLAQSTASAERFGSMGYLSAASLTPLFLLLLILILILIPRPPAQHGTMPVGGEDYDEDWE